ncbi:MAG: hypothetical protein ACHQ2F_14370, partial [Desulfobaccales bacterium]
LRKECKMDDLGKTIDLLKVVIKDNNCVRMNKSTIKGYLGELIVKRKLKEEGILTNSLGNQSGYDLEYRDIKIDVKLSCLKNEFKLEHENWGWALKHQNKKKEIKATHFVCVALNNNYEVEAYYVINAINYKKFPNGIKQFSGVEHGFGIYTSDLAEIKDQDIKENFSKSDKLIREKKFVVKVEAFASINDAIQLMK